MLAIRARLGSRLAEPLAIRTRLGYRLAGALAIRPRLVCGRSGGASDENDAGLRSRQVIRTRLGCDAETSPRWVGAAMRGGEGA